METERLEGSSGVELVLLAAASTISFKAVGAELERRDVDAQAADALVDAHRSGRMPPWLVAYLLGCVRAPRGYDVTREILLDAPGLLAESYAGPAMARIAGVAAHDDLLDLMMDAPRQRSREGAAYGLSVLARPGTAALMLRAVKAGRIRRHPAASIVGKLPDALPTLLEWFASDDVIAESMALDGSHSLLAATAGTPDVALARAIRRTLHAGRVKQAPHTRKAILDRIASALEADAG